MEYLGDGITESIINSLSQLPHVRVMARSTVFRYRRRSVDPQAVGRDLGLHAVLTGRVVPHGDTLTISTELVEVGTGWRLWGEVYTRSLADIFVVQRGHLEGNFSEAAPPVDTGRKERSFETVHRER